MEWILGTGCTAWLRRAALAATMVAALATLAGLGAAAAYALPAPNPSAYVTNGTVYATASAGGDTYIGGNFTQVGPRVGHGMKLTATGDQYDPSFPDVAGGAVHAVASDGVGGWFIGGDFTSVQGQPRNRLAHILAEGSLDLTWNPDADATVRTIAVSGADVFFGGDFTTVNRGTTRNHIAKTPTTGDGTVDASWDPNVNSTVEAIAVSGADVFFGGDFTTVKSTTPDSVDRNRIAKTPAAGDGTVDANWDPDADAGVWAIAVSGGDVFFGGAFTFVKRTTLFPVDRNRIAKTATTGNGTVDTSWNPNANGGVGAIAVSGTDVFFGGGFTTVNGGTTRNGIAKTPTNGTGKVDQDWNPNANKAVRAIAVSGADVFFGGAFTTVNGSTSRNYIAKTPTTGDGKVDASWNPNATDYVRAIAVSGSDLYAGGSFASAGANLIARNRIARLQSDGVVDPSWDPDANNTVYAIAVSGADVFFGGDFTTVNGGTTRNRLAKTPTAGTGTVDPSWNPDANFGVYAIAVSGGEVFFGGAFTTVRSSTPAPVVRNRIAKTPTMGDGAVDGTWNPNASSYVYAIAVSDGNIFFGGYFTTVNGSTTRNRIAKTPKAGDGTVDPSWDPDANQAVYAIAVSGADVCFGGNFTAVKSTTPDSVDRNRIAKTPTTGNGTVDASWDPNANAGVYAIAVAGTDVLFAGDFMAVNGSTTRNYIAKTPTTGDGTVDASWDPNANSYVSAIAVSGNDVFVGGAFSAVGGHTAQGFARVASSTAAFQVDSTAKDFGNQDLGWGPTATQTLAVRNSGAADLANTSVTLGGPDANQFAKSDDLCQGQTLAPGATCTVKVAFDPDSQGAKTASLTFVDNAEGSPHEVLLQGTGLEPAAIPPEPPAPGPGHAPKPADVSPAPPLAGSVSLAAEVIVARGKIAVGKSGAFAVQVACPAKRSEACHGKIAALARAKKKRKPVAVGSARYGVPLGGEARVVVKLTKTGLKLLRKARPARRLRITLAATSSIAGNQAIAPVRAVLAPRVRAGAGAGANRASRGSSQVGW